MRTPSLRRWRRCLGMAAVLLASACEADRLLSDDGATLYLDGALLIDNDGLHTATSASNEIRLNAGPHDLRVDYFQGPGAAMALGPGFPVTPETRVPASAYNVPAAIAR